ncbi:MAG: S9 family peptidase, partial [Flavobacteriaceae bacterium]|nr:S9 family peptidase [Flavobacteriaceae bacterium]
MFRNLLAISLLFIISYSYCQNTREPFQPLDVFGLEFVSDPQIAPDGSRVVYRRNGYDIMKDRRFGNLWIINSDGTDHRKLTSREVNESQARWSPDGKRLAFSSATEEGSELYMYWMDTGQIAKLSQLERSPGNLTWSPNGKQLAFTMFVAQKPPVVADMPRKPKGAKWADKPRITDRLKHEADGRGYMEPGFSHIFIIPSEGGTARQLTSDNYNHGGALSFSPDGKDIYFSANLTENWEYDFRNSEVYKVNVDSGKISQLSDQQGPDGSPKVSPDGRTVAFISFKDKVQTYQLRQLNIMNTDGSGRKILTADLDRSVAGLQWANDGKGIYFMYDDKGNTKVAYVGLNGKVRKLADNLGGNSIGRPYGGGAFSVSNNGSIAYTYATPYHPAELAVLNPNSRVNAITDLNQDVLGQRELGQVKEVWYKSTVDGRDIQGWII